MTIKRCFKAIRGYMKFSITPCDSSPASFCHLAMLASDIISYLCKQAKPANLASTR